MFVSGMIEFLALMGVLIDFAIGYPGEQAIVSGNYRDI